LLGKEAREALKKGVDAVYEPVSRTMGAKGRNNVFDSGLSTEITNDGDTIAGNIWPKDPFEFMGADLVKQACGKTNTEAGDGTTTTVVLTQAIIEEALKEVDKGVDPNEVSRKLEIMKNITVDTLKVLSKEVSSKEDLFNIANISVENRDIATVVSDAVSTAGKNGVVQVFESYGSTVESEQVEGYSFNKGYISPYMITNQEKMTAELEDAAVLITDKAMNLNSEMIGFLNESINAGINKILLIADNIEGELLQTLVVNRIQGKITVIAVRRPETTEELEDLAILTGGVAITKQKAINKFKLEHYGKTPGVIVKKEETIVIGSPSELLDERIKNLQAELENDPLNDKLKERLSKLTTGIITLKVGAKTEAERVYLKRKVDDAVGACQSALQEGVVAGGGVTLRNIADQYVFGYFPFANAIRRPYQKILQNAGITDDGKNYNVLTGETVDDMVAAGIIDPTKVVRCALENAVSLAKTFITIESATVEAPEESGQTTQS